MTINLEFNSNGEVPNTNHSQQKIKKEKEIQQKNCQTSALHYFQTYIIAFANVFLSTISNRIFINLRLTIGHHNLKLNLECMVIIKSYMF